MKRLFWLLLLLCPPVFAAEPYVTTGQVNVRSIPSTKGKIYTAFKKGHSITLIKKVNTYWSEVEDGHYSGYVSSAYIKPASGGSVQQPAAPVDNSWQSKADNLINFGVKFIGARYQYGAKPHFANNSFDCSAFTQHVFSHVGVTLPRTSSEQARKGTKVTFSQLRKGDLMYFRVFSAAQKKQIYHVGIFMGPGKILQTASSPTGVKIYDLTTYWRNSFLYGRRLI